MRGNKFSRVSFTIPQQIQQLLHDKKHILITFGKDAGGDAIGSALALFGFLKHMGKTADIISDEFVLPNKFSFLKHANTIRPSVSHLQKFIITVDVKENGVEELSYDIKNEELRIFITPKQGALNRQMVRTAETDFKYDLIIVLATPDLESLGALYHNNTDLFYKTPVIAIDHDPRHEHFGQVNVIDITATSTAEVLFQLQNTLGDAYLDQDIATALLTAMIAKTRSFRSDSVKPHTLATASKLMSLGANREQIVQQLYRTRSIATLKLWGSGLQHMHHEPAHGLVWTTITRDEMVRAGATEQDLYDIIDELLSTSPEAKVVLLLHEHKKAEKQEVIHGLIHTTIKQLNATDLVLPYHGKGDHVRASFNLSNTALAEAEKSIVQNLRERLTMLKETK